VGKEPDEIRREIDDTRARMGDTAEAIAYKADVKSRAKESVVSKRDAVVSSVRNAKDSVVGAIAGTGESMADAMENMRHSTVSSVQHRTPTTDEVRQGARRAVGLAQENPLGLALGSVAVGFLAGMLVPSTRIEEERLGPIATEVKDKVTETGEEVLERGRQVAQETAQVAREAAGEAAQRTMDTARESGQQQGQELKSSAQDKASDISPTT